MAHVSQPQKNNGYKEFYTAEFWFSLIADWSTVHLKFIITTVGNKMLCFKLCTNIIIFCEGTKLCTQSGLLIKKHTPEWLPFALQGLFDD